MDCFTIERENTITNQNILRYNKKDYLLKIIDNLEKEFDRILSEGFDENSSFYDYIEDLRIVIGKLNE
jgi:hypothetical protein